MSRKPEEPLVPPRKAIAALDETPDVLELLLRWCPEKDAGRPLGCIGASIRAVVERLGTLERDHYLESARRLSGTSSDPSLPGLEPARGSDSDGPFADCELPELLTRFRHFRAQSVAFLEELPPEAWERGGRDPALGPVTLGRVVTHWVHHDQEALASLNTMCAEITKS